MGCKVQIKKNPEGQAPIGVYSLTRSNPATKVCSMHLIHDSVLLFRQRSPYVAILAVSLTLSWSANNPR